MIFINVYAFIITSLAGLSTLIGFLFIFIKGKDNIISIALGFASGVMITLSITDLIPNSFILISNYNNLLYSLFYVLIAFLIGIIISGIIDQKIEKLNKNEPNLYKIGVITMIIIMMHNIPEGIATYITTSNNIDLGINLAIAIALHNIPEGISISIPIYYSTNNKIKAFLYTFISGISELIGAIMCCLFLSNYINDIILGIIYSIIGGMMINIGINELYKESINYNKKYTMFFLFLGSIFMIINHLLFN